jgi:hypothetical protein
MTQFGNSAKRSPLPLQNLQRLVITAITAIISQFIQRMSVKVNSTIRVGGGDLLKVTHDSKVLKLPANFNIFLPPAALGNSPQKVPVLFYLCNPLLNQN